MHVQRMLKMSRVYTMTEILSKIFVKNEGILGTWFDKLTDCCKCFALFVAN